MAPDPGNPSATDERSTDDLVALCLAAPDTREGWDAIAVLQCRGGDAEFAQGARLARAATEVERVVGANILAQLGWAEQTHLEDSVAVLLTLLNDPLETVVAAAAIALGHRHHPSAIQPLLGLARHPSAEVRHAVVHGLMAHDDLAAVATLIELTRDPDRDTRDWATFAIAVQTDLDPPELREALFARAGDEDPQIRGEALIGLARRADPRALPLVRAALEGDFHGDWAVEAAATLADPSLGPILASLHAELGPDDQHLFQRAFDDALEACKPRS